MQLHVADVGRAQRKDMGVPCHSFHHPLLHAPLDRKEIGIACVSNVNNFLPILKAKMGNANKEITGNVLLDSGAQISLVRNEVAKTLKLKGKKSSITIRKVGNAEEDLETEIYKIPVRSVKNHSQTYVITAIGLPSISDDIKEVDVTDIAAKLKIDMQDIHRGSGSIDLLIGIDHSRLHGGETRETDQFTARKSPIGWVLFGSRGLDASTQGTVLHVQMTSPVKLTDFWNTESMGVQTNCNCTPTCMSKIGQEEYDIISKSCEKVGNQWRVPYPWRKDPNLLPDNYSQAEKVLRATENRLAKNEEHAKVYNQQMEEMVEMGFARKLTEEEICKYKGPIHYVSHHAVIRPEKKSTPIRIVFNSSASFQGYCLNDFWLKGPDLLNCLLGVLLRFREEAVAVCGDISKMYHRVLIPEGDQHVHRYLWRNLQLNRKPDVYIKTVLTFGDKPSAAMAQIALRRTAEDGEDSCPEAARIIKEDTYMDDICFSIPTEDEAVQVTKELDEVLKEGGFKVKGWSSNKRLKAGDKLETNANLLETANEEKVLGVVWNEEKDTFSYRVKKQENEASTIKSKLTKRRVLSRIAQVFDPLGFASAFLVKAKIGMQRLWEMGIDWDQELPKDEESRWLLFFQEMEKLSSIELDRCLTPPDAVQKSTLCAFADASEDAFGACIYLRWLLNDGKFVTRFVTAKSRVAPLKRLTIPRLELQVAVLATRLSTSVMRELRREVGQIIFFTDSMITLSWIRSKAREFKPFVSARVGEIQSNSDPLQWRFVPWSQNPADDISRGIPVDALQGRWRSGPDFLCLPEEQWPEGSTEPEEAAVNAEKRRVQQIFHVAESEPICCTKFSSWRRLIRSTAYVHRFLRNVKIRCNRKRGQAAELECRGPLKGITKFWEYFIRIGS